MDFTIEFYGQDADEHLLPAREAVLAMGGITKSFLIATEYLALKKVKQRYPFHASEVYLAPPEEGSWKIKAVAVMSSMALGVSSSAAWDFSKYVWGQATGQPTEVTNDIALKAINDAHGETEAVVNNVRPHLRAAHDIIGAGANQVIIVGGTGNTVVFDAETKAYVSSDGLDTDIQNKIVSVGALNGNSRFGKIFDHELGHIVTIEVARDVSADTMIVLGDGLGRYLRGDRTPTTYIRYMTYRDHLDRPTKYLILGATRE